MNEKSSDFQADKPQKQSITSEEIKIALGVFKKIHSCNTVLECGIEELNHYYMHCCKEFGKRKQAMIARRYFRKNERREYQRKISEKKQTSLMKTHKISEKKMIKLQVHSNFKSPNQDQLEVNTFLNKCYVCKKRYLEPHHFYNDMCEECGDFNYNKRFQRTELTGKVAVVTGARIKIGFETALILLRNGATVIATTRFPKNAVNRFAKVEDFQEWKERLLVYGLDLKNKDSIYEFCNLIKERFQRLDILINNAAQTVRKPPAAYTGLIADEKADLNQELETIVLSKCLALTQPRQEMKELVGSHQINSSLDLGGDLSKVSPSALLSMVPFLKEDLSSAGFDHNCMDVNEQLVDLRPRNSWVKYLEEVPVTEFVEVLMVNVIGPYILNQQFQPLLAQKQPSDRPSFIVNVSAMEGVFYAPFKSARHPHTNMAKAALNMMTRTCGIDLASQGIYMTSVDTGWVTDEMPLSHENKFTAPLDEVDGAMRIIDPIFLGLQGKQLLHSVFLKDYRVHSW